MEVKVAVLGGDEAEVEVEEGATVEDVLEEAGISLDKSEQVRVNGESVDLESEVEEGTNLTIVSQPKGG